MATLESRLSAVVTAIGAKIKSMVPRLVPTGGTTGQVLSKASATDFAVWWQTPASENFSCNFSASGDIAIPARTARTISMGNAQLGTGTVTYAKSTAAAPNTFVSTALPATLEAGAWLKVTASGVTGLLALDLYRSA